MRTKPMTGRNDMRTQSVAVLLTLASALGACTKEEPAAPPGAPAPAPHTPPAPAAPPPPAPAPAAAPAADTGPIKVGILHSLSGPMAISETSLKDVALMT